MLIYQIQLPENVATSPPIPSVTADATPRTNETSPSQMIGVTSESVNGPAQQPLPTPVTQTTTTNASRTFLSFLIHHIRTDAQARLCKLLYCSLFVLTRLLQGLMLFIFLTVIVRVILSPLLSIIFVTAAYSSIWLPQIVRSARRGRTSGLANEYVFGTTICRLYFLLCK